MVKYGIKIFARIRPTKKAAGLYEIGDDSDNTSTLTFTIPRLESSGIINNKRELFQFRFNQLFDQPTKQDEVFEAVARPVIDNCLQGYNGTIFAYGQTGSGKTFTITGGAERYSDRGIIPRTLSYLFQQFTKSPGSIFTTHISYLEIYNESGYDLLDPKHEASRLEDLPKVSLLEDSHGDIHLKNLSLHQTANEEEALNWLFLGDTNRMIAETPMNMASTRSHCIFTIHISVREPGSDIIRKAKLHLVDLAGSERVAKSGIAGTQLTEAKCINLSLHFLEQVIVALSEKSRTHIPYRNSMMTSVLRDSLGGNCKTSMIATLSVEKRNIEESITTCRFAQRVALIKNEAILNEELDPKLMVSRLQQQVFELKQELTMATGEERTDELTPKDKDSVHILVEAFLDDASTEAKLILGPDMRKILLAFQIMKARILELQTQCSTKSEETLATHANKFAHDPTFASSPADCAVSDNSSAEEIQKLQERVQQRDDEINILLKMLKQERRKIAEADALMREKGIVEWSSRQQSHSPILGRTSPVQFGSGAVLGESKPKRESGGEATRTVALATSSGSASRSSSSSAESTAQHNFLAEGFSTTARRAKLRAELSQARQEAFDMFRKEIADMSVIDQHKKVLKTKYADAKLLGEKVNASRMSINKLKASIEKHRISKGVQGLVGSSTSDVMDPKEEELKRNLESQKTEFKKLYNQLKTLKTEIEHTQHLLERAKMQLQREFEEWWTKQSSTSSDTLTSIVSPPNSSKMSDYIRTSFHQPPGGNTRRTSYTAGSSDGNHSVSARMLNAKDPIGNHSQLSPSITEQWRPLDYCTSETSIPSSTHSHIHPVSRDKKYIHLTGDSHVDDDIIAFYHAHQKLTNKA